MVFQHLSLSGHHLRSGVPSSRGSLGWSSSRHLSLAAGTEPCAGMVGVFCNGKKQLQHFGGLQMAMETVI